ERLGDTDEAGASFVSITQSFNTTTSMGRLTLNVLLSFAQFEREVISERVRDKVAASKRKGMWMGGNCPLGYDIRDRKLIVNEVEAKTVRLMMERYLALGNVADLVAELRAQGITSKVHRNETGKVWGGQPVKASALYHLLQNPIFRGLIVHKGETHPGEHDPIVDEKLFDAVQQQLASNRLNRRNHVGARNVSLLAGMIRDGEGRRMTPSHSMRGDIRYRYYNSVNEEGGGPFPRPIRVTARNIEKAVVESFERLIADHAQLILIYPQHDREGFETADLIRTAGLLKGSIPTMAPSVQRGLFLDLGLTVIVHSDRIEAKIDHAALAERLGLGNNDQDQAPVELIIRTIQIRRGDDVKLKIEFDAPASSSRRDSRLLELIAKAHQAKRQLGLDGSPPDIASIADYQARNDLARLARFAFLSPDLTMAILEGSQPEDLSVRKLIRTPELPLDWKQQRHIIAAG
ncbi:MAG: recombinase family protein, partial [Verrucomicrobiaceae bacterium]